MIGYCHVGKRHPETAHWFRTFLAPPLGGIGMLYVAHRYEIVNRIVLDDERA